MTKKQDLRTYGTEVSEVNPKQKDHSIILKNKSRKRNRHSNRKGFKNPKYQ